MGYNSKVIHYESKRDKNGRQSVKATITVNETLFNASLHEQAHGDYIMRGTMSIDSPDDGWVMRARGLKRKKRVEALKKAGKEYAGENDPRLKLRLGVKLKVSDEKKLKEALEAKAVKMYCDYELDIEDDRKRSVEWQQLSPAAAVHALGKKFEDGRSKGKLQAATINRNHAYLKRMIALLGNKPLRDITVKDVKAAAGSLGDDPGRCIRHFAEFWTYCSDKGICSGDNPFREYVRTFSRRKRSPEKLQKSAQKKLTIDTAEEQGLETVIGNEVSQGDGSLLAVGLVKDAGLTSAEAAGLLWQNVIFDSSEPQLVCVSYCKDDSAGATHDHTHPVMPWLADMLRDRYDAMKIKYPKKVDTLPVASKDGMRRMTQKEVTALCRTTLMHVLKAEYNVSEDGQRLGIGVRLLLQTFRHRLEYDCGLINDPAAVRFCLGQSLRGDVTADSYRSFTSPEGQEYLFEAMQRNRRSAKKAATVNITEMPDSCVKAVFDPGDVQRKVGGVMHIKMKPGDWFTISAKGGINANIQARKMKKNAKTGGAIL